jgi:hypothetical protein
VHFRTRKSSGPDSADAARLAQPDAAAARAGGAKPGAVGVSGPVRVSVGIPGLQTLTRTARPPASSRLAAQPGNENASSGRPMSARRHEAALQLAERGFEQLHPVAQVERGQPSAPQTLAAMRSVDGLLDALQSMFGGAAGCNALSLRLLGAVPPEPGGETRYLAPLVLATALHAAGAKTPQDAMGLLEQTKHGESSPQVFGLERTLAATAAGTQALAHLRGVNNDPVQAQRMQEELQLCSALERQGVRLERHSSVRDVVRDLEASAETRMQFEIGKPDDAPLQLLAKATRYAHALRQSGLHSPAPQQSDRAAFVAWKQGGFVESGKGSDFEKAIGRMYKFMSYVERAEHGPRTLGGLLQDARSYFGRAVGVGKSPLSATRYGTLGGEKGLVHEEAAKVQQKLNGVLSAAVDNLVEELRDPAARQADGARHARLARAAVLDLWRESGHTDHTVQAVMNRAAELVTRAGAPMQPLDESALVKSLGRFTRKVRTESGESSIRVGMRALEAVAVSRTGLRIWRRDTSSAAPAPDASPTATPAQRRQHLAALLTELRAVDQVGTDSKPLFKLSDIKALLRGTPREGPTAADAQRVLTALAQAPRTAFSNFSDGASHGVGSLGAVALRAGALLGTPLAYPVLDATAGKSARVSIGRYPTGGRLFIGTQTSRSGKVGVGAGWVAPPLAGQLVTALAVAQATVNHEQSHAQGLTISSRNDKPGWEDKLPQAVDFLFHESSLRAGAGRAAAPGELWRRFAQRFGDDPHLGVSWVNERAATTGASIGATAVARVQAGTNTSIGPGLSASLGISSTRLERSVNAQGADVPIVNHSRQGAAGLSLAVSHTAPFVDAAADRAVAGWGAGVPLVGASLEWSSPGGLGIATFGRNRDGTLNPALCQRDVLFTESKSMIEYINLNRESWEEAIVAQDETGATRPEDARARLNTFVNEAAAAHSPLALHGEFATLAPAVTLIMNGLEARLSTILGHGDRVAASRSLSADERRECHALQNEVHRLLQVESSWVPSALYSVESNSRASTTGLNFGLRVANQEQNTALHMTALLVAGTPKPALAAASSTHASLGSLGSGASDSLNHSGWSPGSSSSSSSDSLGMEGLRLPSGAAPAAPQSRGEQKQGNLRPEAASVEDLPHEELRVQKAEAPYPYDEVERNEVKPNEVKKKPFVTERFEI